MMTHFIRSFTQFEMDEELFFYRVKGHCFWDYIRYDVFYNWVYKSKFFGYKGDKKKSQSRFKKAFRLLRESFLSILYWLQLSLRKTKSYDIIIYNYDRNRLTEGKWVNPHFYPIVESLSKKYSVLLIDPSEFKWDVENNYPCDVLRYRPYYLLDSIKDKFLKYSTSEKKLFDELKNKLEQKFQSNFNIRNIAKNCYSFQIISFKRWTLIFKKYKPKLFLFSDTGNNKGMIEAASTLNVKSINMQHSLLSESNILYHYHKSMSRKLTPALPQYLFTFGPYWRQECRLPIIVKEVGFPLFDWNHKITTQRLASKKITTDKNAILIISDSFFSKDDFVHVALTLARSFPGFTIYYKLRPDDYYQWQERYPEEFQVLPNLKVIDNDETPFYDYFVRSSYQVGINSTALFEGIAFELTTFILKKGWYEEMTRAIQDDHVILVKDAEEIVSHIQNGKKILNTLNCQELFLENCVSNVEEVVGELLEEKL